MNKTLKIILVLSMFIMIQIVGSVGYFKVQTQELCIKVSDIIVNNGSLEQINSEAANYQFEPAGNGISQALFFKLYTIPGLCIVTINNGKPINAKYSSST
ncbi:hypothetical protein [Vibrio vulnificus]|uniref:hypothetical protein n=1 Tax=Vibrio vulnificus TaxID=672 RepID=UPI0005F1E9DC|nr:hypothetical protein [Vibrio vulnificus]EJO9874813.1 hypothetical protein [Vibrio vulnificus]ELV8804896.1 hypothetical protein [Vibrio vulnificus]